MKQSNQMCRCMREQVPNMHVLVCVCQLKHRYLLWFVRMHMRIGEGNAFFLMADSIDLFLLNGDWSMNYKQLWLLTQAIVFIQRGGDAVRV